MSKSNNWSEVSVIGDDGISARRAAAIFAETYFAEPRRVSGYWSVDGEGVLACHFSLVNGVAEYRTRYEDKHGGAWIIERAE
jgi:hypothetical protein